MQTRRSASQQTGKSALHEDLPIDFSQQALCERVGAAKALLKAAQVADPLGKDLVLVGGDCAVLAIGFKGLGDFLKALAGGGHLRMEELADEILDNLSDFGNHLEVVASVIAAIAAVICYRLQRCARLPVIALKLITNNG